MIFATVGSQLPFQRMIALIDELAPSLGEPVFAQIGKTDCVPRNIEWVHMLPPLEFDRLACEARLLVSHAGIGTILWAATHCKPIVVMPRRAAMHEHRNDHQLATVRHLAGRPNVFVAEQAVEMEALLRAQDLALHQIGECDAATLDSLRHRLRSFAHSVAQ